MISMRATMNTHIKAALVVVLLVRHSPILTSTPTRSRSLTMARRVPRISIRDSSQSFEHISVLGCLDDMAGRYAESSPAVTETMIMICVGASTHYSELD